MARTERAVVPVAELFQQVECQCGRVFPLPTHVRFQFACVCGATFERSELDGVVEIDVSESQGWVGPS